MKKDSFYVIGVMSGTSLDGIDLCYANFEKKENWTFTIISAETMIYSGAWRERLRNSMTLSAEGVEALDTDYTSYLGETVARYIASKRINNLDAVCSHGHTVFHQPGKGITKQIGNRQQIATMTQQTVVCDFRVQGCSFGRTGSTFGSNR